MNSHMYTAFVAGFIAGLLATPHCLGMCGGFPLHLAKSSIEKGVFLRQILFIVGKTFTYVFLGTLASTLGIIIFKNTSFAPNAKSIRILAGAITVIIGLVMLGFRLPRVKALQFAAETGVFRSLYTGFLSSPGPLAAFLLGIAVGFLPCPLPMGALMALIGTHNIPVGIAGMAGIGLGTAPGLLAVGLFGIHLDRRFAKVGMRAAGVVVICIGLLTIGRASGLIHAKSPINKVAPSCCGEHRAK